MAVRCAPPCWFVIRTEGFAYHVYLWSPRWSPPVADAVPMALNIEAIRRSYQLEFWKASDVFRDEWLRRRGPLPLFLEVPVTWMVDIDGVRLDRTQCTFDVGQRHNHHLNCQPTQRDNPQIQAAIVSAL